MSSVVHSEIQADNLDCAKANHEGRGERRRPSPRPRYGPAECLLRRLGDGAALQGDRGLREQAPVDR